MRRIVCLLLAVALTACPPPARFAVVRPGLSCDRATRVAYRTLTSLGYTVTNLVPANPQRPGVLAATKPGAEGEPKNVRVNIRCDAQGAVLQPIEEDLVPNYDFSRVFGYSFTSLVQRPDVENPGAGKGLEVQIRTIPAHEAILDLGAAPTVGSALLIRVTIRNQTERAVSVDPGRMELVPADGESALPLADAALDASLASNAAAERVRKEQLRADRVTPGAVAIGYLLYPFGHYREARISIEDVETGETEGFVAPVQ